MVRWNEIVDWYLNCILLIFIRICYLLRFEVLIYLAHSMAEVWRIYYIIAYEISFIDIMISYNIYVNILQINTYRCIITFTK